MGFLVPRSFVARQQWSEQVRRRKIAHELERRITAAIQRVYPEHLFTVKVSPDDGNIFIDHPLLRYAKARYFVPHFVDDPEARAVKLCGEILERANVKRGELKYFEDYDGTADDLAKTQFKAR